MADGAPVRGSLRSRSAATLSAVTLRRLSGMLPPERAWGLWLSRQIVAGVMDTFGPPFAGATVEAVDFRQPDGRRVVGEWVRAPGTEKAAGAIYFLHGSGYVMCSPRTHRRLTAWLSRLTGLPVFCVDYRLAPRYRFPTAAEDVRAAWDWLTRDRSPEDVVVVGDSAGGHLAVDLLLQPEVAASKPAALVLFSPLIDLTFTLATATEQQRRDPTIRAVNAIRLLALYSSGTDPAHPRLTLNVAAGQPLPPALIQAGGAEMLSGDARRLAADIQAAGGSCELQIWPDQVHVFQALPRLSPEATRAMAYAARFITTALAADAGERVG